MLLTCVKCGETKESVEFSPRKDGATGFNRQCRKCRIYIPVRKEDRTEEQNEKLKKAWRKRNDKKTDEVKARALLRNAVRNGDMTKPLICESCGSRGLMHGHHDDYSKPLDVKWLCKTCHVDIHKQK